jgi:hypothetical protein
MYYSKRFKEISNEIENLRLEIYSSLHINIDNPDDKSKLDDMLFTIQSELRYNVTELIECYED